MLRLRNSLRKENMTSVNEERVPVRQWQALYRTGAFYTSEYSAMEKAG